VLVMGTIWIAIRSGFASYLGRKSAINRDEFRARQASAVRSARFPERAQRSGERSIHSVLSLHFSGCIFHAANTMILVSRAVILW
jgi:hypothetical protein